MESEFYVKVWQSLAPGIWGAGSRIFNIVLLDSRFWRILLESLVSTEVLEVHI